MEEIWKDIKGYEGLYQISNLGRVKSYNKKIDDYRGNKTRVLKGKILKQTDNGSGYLIVGLRKNKKRKNFYIHRLVACHFIKKEKNKNIVNHKDFNKYNNCINNLKWVTQKENINYSIKNMKHYKKKKNILNEQYIRKKGKKYELTLKKKYIGTYKTLEKAIQKRNELIKGDDYFDGFTFTK